MAVAERRQDDVVAGAAPVADREHPAAGGELRPFPQRVAEKWSGVRVRVDHETNPQAVACGEPETAIDPARFGSISPAA